MRSRLIDSGAVFAGWIGLGMALVLAIAFELVIPVQTIVFLLALPMGIVIGVYANVRSERWRPRGRVLANAAWAGFVTGLGIALLYVLIRLIFIYGDTGALPDGRTLACQPGPDCLYERYVAAGQGPELAAQGISDPRSLEAAVWRELVASGGVLFGLTLGGALIGGLARSVAAPAPNRTAIKVKTEGGLASRP